MPNTSARVRNDESVGDSPVPLVNISGWTTRDMTRRGEIATAVDKACREIGFLVVAGHSVPAALADRIWRATQAFFALPAETKQKYASASSNVFTGYRGFNGGALARAYNDKLSAPDLRETFAINPISFDKSDAYYQTPRGQRLFVDNIWPREVADFETAWTEYYRAMEKLAGELMEIFAVALGLEPTFFEDKINRHVSKMMASNYPEPAEQLAHNQSRAGAHTDYGSLTILLAEDKPGGLQVQCSDGEWRKVPIVPDTFVVNIGDLMARWTNDCWVSTIHRVANPPFERRGGSARQSIAFFHQPNYDAVIECIASCRGAGGAKYPITTSGEHLESLLKQIRTAPGESVL